MRHLGQLPEEVLRARRTASVARATLALCAIMLLAWDRSLAATPIIPALGFAIMAATATVQIAMPETDWLRLEESLAPLSAALIIGFGPERVGVLSILWLAAVASGVVARGGRVGRVGRAMLVASLALPIVRYHTITLAYAGLILATVALLLTCGRMTRELRGMLERARHAADHDGLTQALSRAAFRDRLDRVADLREEHPHLAVLLLDLENFGAINKSNGHAAGDAVLVSVVERLRGAVGERGVVGRLGGDEFGILVSDPDPVAVAKGLLDVLGAEHRELAPLRASVGIALIPRDGEDAETLLRAVDVALRVAKRTGRRQVSVYAGESVATPGARGAREALQRLLEGEGLSMVVQPIVTTLGRETHAYEALARFHTRGTSNPLHWFALADEFGLRDDLELACLSRALELLPGRPPDTWLSVNLSGPLLLDPRTDAVLREPASLRGLILELTENSLLEDTPGLHTKISALQEHGVRFAVDDMGAGYSGLRQMTTVHPSYLKLDRSLISDIDTDPDRGALISALLGYARQTGGRIVARRGRDRGRAQRSHRAGRRARPGVLRGASRLAVARGRHGVRAHRPGADGRQPVDALRVARGDVVLERGRTLLGQLGGGPGRGARGPPLALIAHQRHPVAAGVGHPLHVDANDRAALLAQHGGGGELQRVGRQHLTAAV